MTGFFQRLFREKWLQQLSTSDEVRVLIRTPSVLLRKLLWHLWDLVEDYPLAEVAYCAPESEQSASLKTPTYRDKVRMAEREARLKLQGLEDNFPCASWLPVIFQNPAAVSPMWQELGRRPTEVCPYRGLFAFREEDAPFFFGRDAFTQMLVEAVQQQSLVAVIAPSGSGKSSVVFAGLIPRLRVGAQDLAPLHIVSFRPGDRPLRNLAAKLVPLLENQMSETDQLLEINKQTKALRQGGLSLRDVVTRILEKNSGDRFLLVVDQFEELYTLCRDARERLLFLDNLLEAVNSTPMSVRATSTSATELGLRIRNS